MRLQNNDPKQAKRTIMTQQTVYILTNRANKFELIQKPGIELEASCASTKTRTKVNADPISEVTTLQRSERLTLYPSRKEINVKHQAQRSQKQRGQEENWGETTRMSPRTTLSIANGFDTKECNSLTMTIEKPDNRTKPGSQAKLIAKVPAALRQVHNATTQRRQKKENDHPK